MIVCQYKFRLFPKSGRPFFIANKKSSSEVLLYQKQIDKCNVRDKWPTVKVTIAIIIILILSGNAKYGLNYIMMSSANGDIAL
ncbi:hypothetical protein D4X54_06165 [Salmonella enterica subsp. enterica serovar Give]|uniref:Uncharacterized protein n=2 Tax=Salmonella enterica TaxID=28901 RepID=A0A494J061_SALET|nr:hypothetical protein [Salmonella enterica subsp. enterica serovar Give]EAA9018947.1 hypothetical protein [Salmonella enterica]EBW7472351.1 hypothetical protein [Salmonella enterica subsp. enterica serovar Binza]PJK83465.1 hypothetical protein CU636_12250 [Salmonella enterica subsp. enterica serovar Typhimurium]EAA2012682.1 hypothetical protein [Salmonella enterica subsp. enterica serovar Give]